MIAALYVARGGCYYGLPDVDPWDIDRDARLYPGPHPVVAHPPCERWGRYWSGGPMLARTPLAKKRGDDGGCFAAALASIRRWGGVLEHPEASSAWRTFGLIGPRRGGWEVAGDGVGWTCCVDQGQYGHRAAKATWLYAVGCKLPSLNWARARARARARIDDGCHSAEERRAFMRPPPGISPEFRAARRAWMDRRVAAGAKELCVPERLNKAERISTPLPFRDLLLSMARSVGALARAERSA